MQRALTTLVFVVCSLVLVTGTPAPLFAARNELHYQSIESVRGENVIVADHSPGGDTRHSCDAADGTCKKIGKTDTSKPSIRGKTDYLMSSQGHYGVHEQSFPVSGQLTTRFTLYDVSATKAKKIGSFSTIGTPLKKAFSPNEQLFVVVTANGIITRYDVAKKKSQLALITQRDLPFFNISYAGTYISAFNYATNAHRIWNTKTGVQTEIPGTPSYIEFSALENEVAFLVDNNGFKNLSVATGFTDSKTSSLTTTKVASGSYLVEDYIYLGEDLYYLSNKTSPLTWNIYVRGETRPFMTNASYGNYLKRVSGKLAYTKIEGKNANIYLYDKDTDKHMRLNAAPFSSIASNITRSEITIANRTAALLSPRKTSSKKSETKHDLFIWLHGGPQRQTSLGYHPYLSYAVYDELLEKLASGGNYVLKLDYSGSWGYGQKFIDKLTGQVGVVEISDVKNALTEFKKKHAVGNVYLIGNSYGGYMTFRTLNDVPDLIDGIVSINGVADWSVLIGSIPSSPFSKVFNGPPNVQNIPLYQKASVFSNVDAIDKKTPLVVLYGTKDNMVPVAQSIQYDAFMRAQKKNVTLVALKGEEHVLRKRSTLLTLCKTVISELSLDHIACTK